MGEIAIPARIFSDFINTIQDEKVTLVTKNNTLTINAEHYKTSILGFDPKDFPIIPKIKSEPIVSVPANMFKGALVRVVDSMAISETRPELAGILVQVKENQCVLVSTDIFRSHRSNSFCFCLRFKRDNYSPKHRNRTCANV